MPNAKWTYINQSGVEVDYDAVVNYNERSVQTVDYVKRRDVTASGALVLKNRYNRFQFQATWEDMDETQKNIMLAITASPYCTFYPDGAGGDGYYGEFTVLKPRQELNKWTLKGKFVESTDVVRVFNRINVKITNQDNTEYSGYLWPFDIDTQAEIAAGRLDAAGTYLRVEDKNGLALDYWYDENTWNTSATRFFVKVGTVEANAYFYVLIVLDDESANPGPTPFNAFDYYEDFSGDGDTYTPGDIDTQNGWTRNSHTPVAGSATAIVGSEDANTGVELLVNRTADCNNVSIERALSTIGANLLIINHKKKSDTGGNFWFGWCGASVTNALPHDAYLGFLQQTSPATAYGRIRKWNNQVATYIDGGQQNFTYYNNLYNTSRLRWNDSGASDFHHNFSAVGFSEQTATDTDFSTHSKLIIGASCITTIFINYIGIGKVPNTPPTVVVNP